MSDAPPMLYLSGVTTGVLRDGVPVAPYLGVMLTPEMGNMPDLRRVPWAADTGLYSAKGQADYDEARYIHYLRQHLARGHGGSCLFVTLPDVVGDAPATLARSLAALPAVQAVGLPLALVAQDGLERRWHEWPAWDALRALFLGGTTRWKLSQASWELTQRARDAGLWVHMGRVNSYRRFSAAQAWGCRSADGTFLASAPEINLRRVASWCARLAATRQQRGLFDDPVPVPAVAVAGGVVS